MNSQREGPVLVTLTWKQQERVCIGQFNMNNQREGSVLVSLTQPALQVLDGAVFETPARAEVHWSQPRRGDLKSRTTLVRRLNLVRRSCDV